MFSNSSSNDGISILYGPRAAQYIMQSRWQSLNQSSSLSGMYYGFFVTCFIYTYY